MPNSRKNQQSSPKKCRIFAANPRKGSSPKVKALEAHVLAKLAAYNVKLDYAMTLIFRKEGGHA
jgi:hypothetical protein